MSYEEVLGHLHAMLGRQVSVLIGGARDQPPELVAVLRGPLLRGTARQDGPPIPDDERMVFDVGEASFVIARAELVEAELIADDQDLLMVQLGGCELTVSALPR